jgi:hypothetical protein
MKRLILAIGIGFMLTAAGCATKEQAAPTAADAMRERASESTGYAVRWDEAQAMVAAGEAQIKQGEQQLQQAREQREAADRLEREATDRIADGRSKIAKGQALATKTEEEYAETLPRPAED